MASGYDHGITIKLDQYIYVIETVKCVVNPINVFAMFTGKQFSLFIIHHTHIISSAVINVLFTVQF